jgi:tetratricopeptide (TPR) repeat protein
VRGKERPAAGLNVLDAWNRTVSGIKLFSSSVLSISGFLVIVLVFAFLIRSLTLRQLYIEPISVPKSLAEIGYTPEVAAGRLRAALTRVVAAANSIQQAPDVALRGDHPDIVVPSVGISLDTIAAGIRTFLPVSRRQTVSGEVIGTDGQCRLRLRIDGQEFFFDAEGSAFEKLEDVNGKNTEATESFRIATRIDGANWEAHWRLAMSLKDHNQEEALAEAKKAVALAPFSADCHLTLGYLLQANKRTEDAIAAFSKARELNPDDTAASKALKDLRTSMHSSGHTVEVVPKPAQ